MRLSNLPTFIQLERNFKKGTISTVHLLNHYTSLPIIANCPGVIGEGVMELALGIRKVCIEKLAAEFLFN